MGQDELKQVIASLAEKASNKQFIYRTTLEVFTDFKHALSTIADKLHAHFVKTDPSVEIYYRERGEFEAEIKFSGDVLIFSMHTNVFNFDPEHSIHKLDYVKQDAKRIYCGLIQVHNFLADSIKYNRVNDIGYLVARIFINKEKHFFIEGKGQLGFLYEDFSNMVINRETIEDIIITGVQYCLDFELLTPPYEQVQEVTLMDRQEEFANSGIATGKHLGFQFRAEVEKGRSKS